MVEINPGRPLVSVCLNMCVQREYTSERKREGRGESREGERREGEEGEGGKDGRRGIEKGREGKRTEEGRGEGEREEGREDRERERERGRDTCTFGGQLPIVSS